MSKYEHYKKRIQKRVKQERVDYWPSEEQKEDWSEGMKKWTIGKECIPIEQIEEVRTALLAAARILGLTGRRYVCIDYSEVWTLQQLGVDPHAKADDSGYSAGGFVYIDELATKLRRIALELEGKE